VSWQPENMFSPGRKKKKSKKQRATNNGHNSSSRSSSKSSNTKSSSGIQIHKFMAQTGEILSRQGGKRQTSGLQGALKQVEIY